MSQNQAFLYRCLCRVIHLMCFIARSVVKHVLLGLLIPPDYWIMCLEQAKIFVTNEWATTKWLKVIIAVEIEAKEHLLWSCALSA